MRVVQLGEGDPTVAIVGAVHGDEPCGARAIERLIRDDPPVAQPVKLVVANEAALDADVRFIDSDLNRAFGDEVQPSDHEVDLAPQLAAELEGCLVLSIHSTQSSAEPFALVHNAHERARSVCPYLSVAALVEMAVGEGRLFAIDAELIELEAGLQGSPEATENAYRIAREFLTATGVLPGSTLGRELPRFALGKPIPKPPGETYEVLVENFTRVEADQPFATVDGEPVRAESAFYPVLLSANGYADIFGYEAEQLEPLPEPPTEQPR